MIFGKYVNKYYKKYWYWFVLVFIALIVVDVFQLLIPTVIGNLISVFSNKDLISNTTYNLNPLRVFTGFTNAFTLLANDSVKWYQTDMFLTIISLLIIAILIVLGRVTWRIGCAHIGANIERDMRKELFYHTSRLPLSFFSDKKVGGLLSYFTNDIQTIKECFTDGLIYLTDLVVLGSCAIFLMMNLSWQITLFTAIPLLGFIVLGGFIGKGESKRYKISSDAFEDMSDYVEENLQGYSVIKAFNKEYDKQRNFRKYTLKCKDTSMSYLKYSALIDGAVNIVLAITFAVLFIMCSIAIIQSDVSFAGNVKDIGDLSKFAGYYDSLIWPMAAGGMLIDMISRGSGAKKRLSNIFESKDDILDKDNQPVEKLSGNISFNHLTFSYQDSQDEVLKGITLDIKSGQKIGILGRTGSGKSTLVNLLLKLYNVGKGELFVDDKDIQDLRREDIRRDTAIVLQEAFLFSGTIKDNIAFTSDGPLDMDRVKYCAHFAGIDNEIEQMKDGYDTLVGEKGSTLSGGQKQRISIARAIYKEPKILIFDDSLSAVDADTEKVILKNLEKMKMTTIVIAHRISALENMDKIIVLKEGRVIGFDSHENLLKDNKFYSDMVKLQELEKEVNN